MASTHGGVLVTWRYPRGADCLRGFRVEFAATNERKFAPLNKGRESIMSFYDHRSVTVNDGTAGTAGSEGSEGGWYRVKALDFWGASGPYSPPEKYAFHDME